MSVLYAPLIELKFHLFFSKMSKPSVVKSHKWKCEQCSASFALQSGLSRHKSDVHDKRKEFICSTCGNKFGNSEGILKISVKKSVAEIFLHKCIP